MTTSELATQSKAAQIERVVIENDLSKLTPEERLAYYIQTCKALGLTWETKPFSYLNLNGKLTLYATRDCTDQLRQIHNVSISRLERERVDDLYVVTATARTPDGREDSSIGAVTVTNLKGEALANAFMKAETKAKRRVTLSICGLGMVDETEVSSIPDARIVEPDALPATVDRETGEIVDDPEMAKAVEAYAKLASNCQKLGIKIPGIAGMDAPAIIAQYQEYKGMYLEAKEARDAEKAAPKQGKPEPVAASVGTDIDPSDLPF